MQGIDFTKLGPNRVTQVVHENKYVQSIEYNYVNDSFKAYMFDVFDDQGSTEVMSITSIVKMSMDEIERNKPKKAVMKDISENVVNNDVVKFLSKILQKNIIWVENGTVLQHIMNKDDGSDAILVNNRMPSSITLKSAKDHVIDNNLYDNDFLESLSAKEIKDVAVRKGITQKRTKKETIHLFLEHLQGCRQ